MSSDTTFEYILYNINEKINIIKDINDHITKLKEHLVDKESELYFLRLSDEYNNYSITINKFNLEIIQFISEYYNINDDYKDIYNQNLIYTYSSNKNHYANIKKNNSKLFNLNELIDIFVDHCYEFKTFNDRMLQFWDLNLNKEFTKKRDIQIADAVLELFRRAEFIESFNKKSLYLLVREMTGYKTHYITKVVSKMKETQMKLYYQFLDEGDITQESKDPFWKRTITR